MFNPVCPEREIATTKELSSQFYPLVAKKRDKLVFFPIKGNNQGKTCEKY
jgi:hypothetical protein